MAIMRFVIDLGIFELLQTTCEPMSSTQIAEKTGAEPSLIGVEPFLSSMCVQR